jgi:hypothetical protein
MEYKNKSLTDILPFDIIHNNIAKYLINNKRILRILNKFDDDNLPKILLVK